MLKVAILVDGEFFLKRYRYLNKDKKGFEKYNPTKTAEDFYTIMFKHLTKKGDPEKCYLYRILYYDCSPLSKKVHNPVSSKCIDFSKSKIADFKLKFLEELKCRRKVAIRLGKIKDHAGWVLRPDKTKDLLLKKISVDDLIEKDVFYDVRQKGVDMRIGLDIAALAYKKLVNRIILISGDSDFVPAAKVARREGIDFILDPMWNHIDSSLHEHIDGLESTINKPK